MKKLVILSMILILGLSLVAYTESMKIDFLLPPVVTGEEIAEGCFAVVNYTPDDDVTATIQIHVIGLASETVYEVRSNFVTLGFFTTNRKGSGHFHYTVTDPEFEEAEERWIGIWIGDTNSLWLKIVEL